MGTYFFDKYIFAILCGLFKNMLQYYKRGKMKKILILCIIFLSACSAQSSEEQTKLYTSVMPLADISNAILGEDYQVEMIYPVDSDPHHYELTSQDMAGIAESDLFIYISDSNNSFVEDLANSGDYNTEFFNVTSNQNFVNQVDADLYDGDITAVVEEHDHDEEEEGHSHEVIDGEIVDPHVWVSPKKLLVIADVLNDEFSEHYADDAELFASNYEQLVSELEVLNQEYASFANEQKYPIVVSHSAYNYLDYDYGIESVSLYGLVSEDEPTAKEIEETIEMINDQNIPAIYVEQNDLENKVITQIAEETGVEVRVLNNMSTTDVDMITALNDNLTALADLK